MARLVTKRWDRVSPPSIRRKQMALVSGSGGASVAGGFSAYDIGEKKVDNDQLRLFRTAIPYAARAVDIWRDWIMHAPWSVVPIDPERSQKGEDQAIEYVTAFLRRPDRSGLNTSWASLNGGLMDDLATVGKGALHKRWDENGQPSSMRALDGSRIRFNEDWGPDFPTDVYEARDDSGNLLLPRYYYMEKPKTRGGISAMGTPMSNEELTLFQLGELTWRQDGLSPMEYLNAFMYAHQDTFRELHIIQRVRHPSGVLAVPTPNPKIIDRLTDMYINKVRGKSGLAIMSIPETSKFIPFGDMNVSASGSFSLIDYIIRGVAAAFGVSTTSIGWTQTTLERSAAEQGDNQDAAKLHILRLWQHYYNTEIIPYLDPTGNLMLMFTELPVEDEADTVESLRVQAGTTQWKSDNDIRISSGLDPIDILEDSPLWPWYNDVKIMVGGTPIPQAVAAGLPQFQTIPGYDWKTGEIDPQIAVQQIAALQPPPPAPDQAQGDGQDGNQANGNGNGNGNGAGGDMSNLAPVPAGKAYTAAEEEHLADLDRFFTEHFRKAKDGGE